MPATEFETGSLTIAVVDWTGFGRENSPNPNAIVLHVDDVRDGEGTLEGRGVEFQTDVIDSGFCLQAYFADPERQRARHPQLLRRYAPAARPVPGYFAGSDPANAPQRQLDP